MKQITYSCEVWLCYPNRIVNCGHKHKTLKSAFNCGKKMFGQIAFLMVGNNGNRVWSTPTPLELINRR